MNARDSMSRCGATPSTKEQTASAPCEMSSARSRMDVMLIRRQRSGLQFQVRHRFLRIGTLRPSIPLSQRLQYFAVVYFFARSRDDGLTSYQAIELTRMPTTTDVQNISLSGGSVLAIFKNKPEYAGTRFPWPRKVTVTVTDDTIFAGKDNVHLIDENLTPRKYAEILGRALGVQVTAKDFSQTDLASQAQSENVFVREFYLDMKCVATISTQTCLCSGLLSFSDISRTIASPSQDSTTRQAVSTHIPRGLTLRSS